MENARKILKVGDKVLTPYGTGLIFEISIVLAYVDVNLDNPFIDDNGKTHTTYIFSINQVVHV